MWELFAFISILFAGMSIAELKKYRRSSTKQDLISYDKVAPKAEISNLGNQRYIKLNLTEEPKETVELKSDSSFEHIAEKAKEKEERKRLWENHWIVKRVKENFEKKQDPYQRNPIYGNVPQEQKQTDQPQVSQQPVSVQQSMPAAAQANIFNSLLEQRSSAPKQEPKPESSQLTPAISQEQQLPKKDDVVDYLPLGLTNKIQTSSTNTKEDKKEKEFDPFAMFD